MDNPFETTKRNWRFILYTIKVEIAIYDLKQSLFWQSVIEVAIMACAFLALLISHSLLIFMHVVHLLRPYVAKRIISNLPKTHEILELLSEDYETAKTQALELIVEKFKSASTFYSHYFILSAIGACFDTLALVYNLSKSGGEQDTYMFYLTVSILFIMFDFFIIFWSKSLIFSFPPNLWLISKEIVASREQEAFLMISEFFNGIVAGVGK
jgi:hypothetical protein